MKRNSNTVRKSQVTMHELVLPNDTNNLGNVLGGRVMHLMDICAAMSAYKHARSHVVTASVDKKTMVLVISMTISSHMELLASALSAGEVFSYTSSAAVTNVPIAQPAPVCMAMHTGHMIAATIFKGLGMAGRTFLGCLLDIL